MPTRQSPTSPVAGLSVTDKILCRMLLQTSFHKHHKYSACLSNCGHGCFLFLLVPLRDKQYQGKITLVGSLVSLAELKSQDSASEPHFCKDFLLHSTLKWGATCKDVSPNYCNNQDFAPSKFVDVCKKQYPKDRRAFHGCPPSRPSPKSTCGFGG